MKYFYVLEGKVGRIDRANNPHRLQGFCTDNFTSCNIIIIVSKDKNKSALIHGDLSLNRDCIQEQLIWAGENATLSVYRRTGGYLTQTSNQPSSQIRNHLLTGLNISDEHFVSEDKEAVIFDISSQEVRIENSIPENTSFHPQSFIITAFHCVESMNSHAFDLSRAGSVYRSPLVFDGVSCVKFHDFSVSPEVNSYLSAQGISYEDDFCNIYQKLDNPDRGFGLLHATNLFYYYLFSIDRNHPNLGDFLKKYVELGKKHIESKFGVSRCLSISQVWPRFLSIRNIEDVNSLCQYVNLIAKNKQIKNYLILLIEGVGNSLFLFSRFIEDKFLLDSSSLTLSGATLYQPSLTKEQLYNIILQLKLITGIPDGWKGYKKGSLILLEYSDQSRIKEIVTLLNENGCCEARALCKKDTGLPVLRVINIDQEKLSLLFNSQAAALVPKNSK